MYKSFLFIVVFSLNFNSAGKEAFMPGKAKKLPPGCPFFGGGGGRSRGVRDMAPP